MRCLHGSPLPALSSPRRPQAGMSRPPSHEDSTRGWGGIGVEEEEEEASTDTTCGGLEEAFPLPKIPAHSPDLGAHRTDPASLQKPVVCARQALARAPDVLVHHSDNSSATEIWNGALGTDLTLLKPCRKEKDFAFQHGSETSRPQLWLLTNELCFLVHWPILECSCGLPPPYGASF